MLLPVRWATSAGAAHCHTDWSKCLRSYDRFATEVLARVGVRRCPSPHLCIQI